MTDAIQQALAAVDEAEKRFGPLGWFHVIRAALQSAAQEAEDWAAIGQWCAALCPRQVTMTGVEYPANEPWAVTLLLGVAFQHQFRGPTRLAALSRAAEFCRKELAK